jgi:hypothetical protein
MNRQRRKSHLARSSFSFPSSTSTNISAGCWIIQVFFKTFLDNFCTNILFW